jgi:ribosomal protein L21E
VTQDGKPLGFFSRKLSDTQRRYPVTEQELFPIMETLKYYKHMLFDHKIIIKTDHKNLTHPLSVNASDRVLRQRLLLEEYGADLQYIQGENNLATDALSRLPIEEFFRFDDANDDFPHNINLLATKQLTDTHLQAALDKQQPIYIETVREGCKIYVHKETDTVYVPASLQSALLQWYHTALQHPGIKCMQATVKENFYWPDLDAAVDKLVCTCTVCQTCKITALKRYGKIPLPTHHKFHPWEEVYVDLIGPWDARFNSTNIPGKSTIEHIHALTIIDKASGWPEFVAINNETSLNIALLFDSEWLCRYPRPARVVYDNGAEFTGHEFQELLESYGIKPVSTTVRNPKSNGDIKRVHLTMGDMLRIMTFSGADWFAELQCALDAIAWAVRTTVNPLIRHSPCHLAFNQDMIYRRAITVNWENVHLERHKSVAASNEKENKSCITKHYKPGDNVIIVLDPDEQRTHPKMSQPTKGPYIITKVNNNGTVEINRGSFHETINLPSQTIQHLIKKYISISNSSSYIFFHGGE